ncbi:MAG: glycosyltransferase family 61 protein [Hymenobacter sp.]|nr:MAG: glycosyltransferase family 61 protein [Hymenobacter sp.]
MTKLAFLSRFLALPPAQRSSQLRVRLAGLLNKLILGPLVSELPSSALRSVEEHSQRDELRPHVVAAHTLLPPLVVTYALPPELPPAFRRTKALEARRAYVLRDVCVSAASGLTWLPDAPLALAESVGCVHRLMGWAALTPELLQPTPSLAETGLLVACPPGPFFHWLFETLPNVLLALARWPEVRILLPPAVPAFAEQALLHLLGPADYTTRVVRVAGPRRVAELLLLSKDEMAGFVHPADIQHLREAFLPAGLRKTGHRALYISRVRTPNRAAPGEPALEAALREQGFEIMYCETLPLLAQVALFAEARLVVGLHGAGLSHLVWATGAVQVAEIFPEGCFNDCYARLASSMGFAYAPFLCGNSRSVSSAGAHLPVADIVAWLATLANPAVLAEGA